MAEGAATRPSRHSVPLPSAARRRAEPPPSQHRTSAASPVFDPKLCGGARQPAPAPDAARQPTPAPDAARVSHALAPDAARVSHARTAPAPDPLLLPSPAQPGRDAAPPTLSPVPRAVVLPQPVAPPPPPPPSQLPQPQCPEFLPRPFADAAEDEARSAALAARLGSHALRTRLDALLSERLQLEAQLEQADEELRRSMARDAHEEALLQAELRTVENGIAELTEAAAAAEGRCTGALMAARQAREVEAALSGPSDDLCMRQALAEGTAAAKLLELRERELQSLQKERQQQEELRAAARRRRDEELLEATAAKRQAEATRSDLTAKLEELRHEAQLTGDEAAALDARLKEGLRQHQRAESQAERLRDRLEQLQMQAEQQEADLEQERQLLARELGSVGMQSVEDIKLAWDAEVRHMDEELRRMAARELELRDKVESAELVAKQAAHDADTAERDEQEMRVRVTVARHELERQRKGFDDELRGLKLDYEVETTKLDKQLHNVGNHLARKASISVGAAV